MTGPRKTIALMLTALSIVLAGCSVSVTGADEPADNGKKQNSEVDETPSDNAGKTGEATKAADPTKKPDPTKAPDPTATPTPEPAKAEVITWERRYIQKGRESAILYDPFICVEYYNNGKREYLHYILEYLGTMVYMENPDDAVEPKSGETYYQDYSKNEMDPELVMVYLDYSDTEIKLYIYDKDKKTYKDTPIEFYYMTDEEIRDKKAERQKMIDDAIND